MNRVKFWILLVAIMLALNRWSLKWYPAVGMVSLILLWLVARSLFERSWVMASVAVCLAEPMFFGWSHIPRPEMTGAAIFLLAIWCGMKAIQNKSRAGFFLAGICCGLATDVHLTGIILVPSMGISFLILQRRENLSSTHLGWFVGGSMLGWSWFVTIHIIPNPTLFAQQWNLHIFLNGVMSQSLSSFFRQIFNEYLRYDQWFWGQGIHRIRLLEGILIFFGNNISNEIEGHKKSFLCPSDPRFGHYDGAHHKP